MIKMYILKNNKGKYYVGITSIEVENRLKRHNAGDVISTRLGRPWQVIHTEEFKDW